MRPSALELLAYRADDLRHALTKQVGQDLLSGGSPESPAIRAMDEAEKLATQAAKLLWEAVTSAKAS